MINNQRPILWGDNQSEAGITGKQPMIMTHHHLPRLLAPDHELWSRGVEDELQPGLRLQGAANVSQSEAGITSINQSEASIT